MKKRIIIKAWHDSSYSWTLVKSNAKIQAIEHLCWVDILPHMGVALRTCTSPKTIPEYIYRLILFAYSRVWCRFSALPLASWCSVFWEFKRMKTALVKLIKREGACPLLVITASIFKASATDFSRIIVWIVHCWACRRAMALPSAYPANVRVGHKGLVIRSSWLLRPRFLFSKKFSPYKLLTSRLIRQIVVVKLYDLSVKI